MAVLLEHPSAFILLNKLDRLVNRCEMSGADSLNAVFLKYLLRMMPVKLKPVSAFGAADNGIPSLSQFILRFTEACLVKDDEAFLADP
ncbi:MAG: hypothetical protein AB1325_14425 [Nitrospirota bacterium]